MQCLYREARVDGFAAACYGDTCPRNAVPDTQCVCVRALLKGHRPMCLVFATTPKKALRPRALMLLDCAAQFCVCVCVVAG
jgi:hypothetical protein